MPDATVRPIDCTPAGICRATRDGNVAAVNLILAQRPELLVVDNPYNWVRHAPRHEVRGAYNKKPIEVAAFFDQPHVARKLLEIARDSHAIRKPWDDHLPFDGCFNSLSVALALRHHRVVQAIEEEILQRLRWEPSLLQATDSDGQTTLHYAARQGHLPLVRELLKLGAEPDMPMTSGRQAIHCLLDRPIDDAPLTVAERRQRHRTARLMLDHGAEFDLWVAAALGDLDRATMLLDADPDLVKQHLRLDGAGFAQGFPLVPAAYHGHAQMVELLLDRGADIDTDLGVPELPEFSYALVAALDCQHFDIVNLLLDRGASLRAHGHCVPPFVDELYAAAIRASGPAADLQYLMEWKGDATPAAVSTFQRVVRRTQESGEWNQVPTTETCVTMFDLRELKRRMHAVSGDLQEELFDEIVSRAAWVGNSNAFQWCLTEFPQYFDAPQANAVIDSTIYSHNRFGSFAQYREIIERCLDFLQSSNEPLTCEPLWMLAANFLECYRYGDTPDMPTIEHMLNLARLFIQYGADVNARHESSGRTPLAEAAAQGYVELVELLLHNGARVDLDAPPHANPLLLAHQHGFDEIADLLTAAAGSDAPEYRGHLTNSDLTPFVPVSESTGEQVTFAPLSHAIIRLGGVTLDGELPAAGGATHTQFVPFPKPFPAELLGRVHIILTNRNHPQIVGSATTGEQDGLQGFLLKATNCHNAGDAPSPPDTSHTVSFSWLAIVLTDSPQQQGFQLRLGLVPWRDYKGYTFHQYDDAAELYSGQPLTGTAQRHVFLATTESNVINAAASAATERGIADLQAYQLSRHEGGGRLYWMVLAPVDRQLDVNGSVDDGFGEDALGASDGEEIWVHVGRTSPTSFIPSGYPSAWRRNWLAFPQPFRERRPCSFVTANAHGVDGHHACVMAMPWNGTQRELPVTGLSLGPIRGSASFDCVTFGHPAAPSADPCGPRAVTAWQHADGAGDEEAWFQLVASGRIGVDEFGPKGATLLLHAVYERHERINTALARRLLALGASVNLRLPDSHLTPLHLAAFLNRIDMARLLIQRGADLQATTLAGSQSPFPNAYDLYRIGRPPLPTHQAETPLHLAIGQRNYALARVLLESGADPNATDAEGSRPVDYLPTWARSPDHPLHWKLINDRRPTTRDDLRTLLEHWES